MLELRYKIRHTFDYGVKFRSDRPKDFEHTMVINIKFEIWGKPNVRPPGAVSQIGKKLSELKFLSHVTHSVDRVNVRALTVFASTQIFIKNERVCS